MGTLSIYEFIDFRLWLSAWHASKQTLDPSFTRTQVSHLLGLPRTRGYFTDLISGKRLSDTFLERLCELLDLPRSEERYFRSLVRLDQAETPEAKELALEQLTALHQAPSTQLDASIWAYYRSWRHGAIRALLATQDLDQANLIRVAARFSPAFTPKQTRESLELLCELGLVAANANGHFKPTATTIATPNWARDEVFRLLQAQQLDLVRQALTHPGDGQRAIATNLVAISAAGHDKIHQTMERFRQEIRSIVHRDPDPADRVILLAQILLPLHRG